MRFELVQHLQAPLEAVEQALVDPEFLASLGRLPKLGQPALLEQRNMGERFFQRVRYDFKGDLSPAVKSFIDPAKLTWVEETTQDRVTHTTDIEIVPEFYRSLLSCTASARLSVNQALGTTDRVTTGGVTVRVPLVGSKAEAAIISGFHEHAALEATALDEWLRATAGDGDHP